MEYKDGLACGSFLSEITTQKKEKLSLICLNARNLFHTRDIIIIEEMYFFEFITVWK